MTTLRQKIAKIIGVEDNRSWQIVDTNTHTGLYLIHYTNDANMVEYGSLRGVVVDVPNQVVVARSYGFSPTIEAESIRVASYDGKIHLEQDIAPCLPYELDPKTTQFTPGFDGTVMRVFLHGGQVYHSTHKKLDAIKSRWANSDTFVEIYDKLGGPRDEALFDLTKSYSPYVHIFLLAHPSLQVASKIPLGEGYLVYVGLQEMWSPQDPPYQRDHVELLPRIVKTTSTFVPNPAQPVLYRPPNFSLDEVNKFLKSGFYDHLETKGIDKRLYPGEFVVAFLYKDGLLSGTLRIESPSYQWRSNMRDNNPDLYQQFYLLSNAKFLRCEFEDERNVYLRRFPLLSYTEEEVINAVPIVPSRDEIVDEKILVDPDRRLYNIYLCYIYALPVNFQLEGPNYYQSYLDDLNGLINQLILFNQRGDLVGNDIPIRAKQIIQLARYTARQKIEQGNLQNLDDLTNAEIANLVKREEGRSLYNLIYTHQDTTEV